MLAFGNWSLTIPSSNEYFAYFPKTSLIKAAEQYFPVVLFIMLYKVVLTFESVDEILKCDHSNESYWVVLSCGTVYYAVQAGSNFWVCGWNTSVTIQMN